MISVQDMTDLLYMNDAYDQINRALFGNDMFLGYKEGNFGMLSKVHDLIKRNCATELKKNDYKDLWKIAEDTSISPEKRAKMLLLK